MLSTATTSFTADHSRFKRRQALRSTFGSEASSARLCRPACFMRFGPRRETVFLEHLPRRNSSFKSSAHGLLDISWFYADLSTAPSDRSCPFRVVLRVVTPSWAFTLVCDDRGRRPFLTAFRRIRNRGPQSLALFLLQESCATHIGGHTSYIK